MSKKTVKVKLSKGLAQKSKRYPYGTLKQGLKIGEVVRDHGGDTASVPKSVIAKELAIDQGGSAFAQQVATAKTYGIVEGHQELRLTDIGRDYYFLISDGGRRIAELEFLAAPPAFRHLLDKFDGSRLPSSSILANELGRNCGVPESWRTRAATFFLGTAGELGVIDDGNYLRYAAAKHKAGSHRPLESDVGNIDPLQTDDDDLSDSLTTPPAIYNEYRVEPTVAVAKPTVKPLGANVWVFAEAGGTVRLESPDPLPYALWQRLQKYVDMLEPTHDNKEGTQMVVRPERGG